MMDMLPTAIGLLVWSNHTSDKGQGQIQDQDKGQDKGQGQHQGKDKSQDQDQGQDVGGERYFEPVLHKGMRLPCTARRTFALATGDH